ncbi:hypothetical protein EPO05_06425 [Patescibacteria group bacterium]|nr:MAG: hypothetical protein EPO05_06425 [Patescibacteria group bacterium]
MRLTKQDIEDKKTIRGGWTKKQLSQWGIPWPPPKGWKQKLTSSGNSLPHPLKCSKCDYVSKSKVDLNDHWLLEH